MFRVNLSDGTTVRVTRVGREYDRESFCYRRLFRWTIRDAAGALVASATDLRGPDWPSTTERRMAATLAAFVGAFAEAGEPDSENYDIFPAELRPWAEANADELALETEEYDA